MSTPNLIRIGGLAAVLAGALLLIAYLWSLVQEFLLGGNPFAVTTTYTVTSAMYLIGGLLLLVAVVGLHARQSMPAGALGLAGFLVALVGTGLIVGLSWNMTFGTSTLAVEAPRLFEPGPTGKTLFAGGTLFFWSLFSGIVFRLGWALFGVAMLRTRVFSRVAAIVLIIGALLPILPPIIVLLGLEPIIGPTPLEPIIVRPMFAATLLFDVAVAWLGSSLLTGRGVSAGQPAGVQ